MTHRNTQDRFITNKLTSNSKENKCKLTTRWTLGMTFKTKDSFHSLRSIIMWILLSLHQLQLSIENVHSSRWNRCDMNHESNLEYMYTGNWSFFMISFMDSPGTAMKSFYLINSWLRINFSFKSLVRDRWCRDLLQNQRTKWIHFQVKFEIFNKERT